jgi:anti-sigma factor RsiW
MNHSDERRVPADLMRVDAQLREGRPEASALELDQIKLRAKTRAARGRGPRRPGSLKSRLASLALVFAFLGTGTGGLLATGVAQAVLGSGSTDTSAASAEYRCKPPPPRTKPPPPRPCVRP